MYGSKSKVKATPVAVPVPVSTPIVQSPTVRLGVPTPDELLTIEQVAAFLKCAPNSVFNLTRSRGKVRYANNPFPAIKFPFGYRVRRSDLLAWIERQALAGAA